MTQGQHRATARVLDILESLSGSEEGLTLTELSQALDAPKSSLFPIVHTLEERRYLRQDDGTGRYTMGPRALVLGAAFSADRGLAPITQVMKEVASKCQETCQMGILDQDRVLYVAREDSPQPIRLISWVGTRLPANATAVGKAQRPDERGGAGAVCRGPAPADRADHHGCGDPAGPVGGGPARGTGYGAGGIHGPAGLLGRAAAAEGNGVRGSQHLRTALPLPGREDRAGPPQSPDCPGGDRKAGRNAKLWLV